MKKRPGLLWAALALVLLAGCGSDRNQTPSSFEAVNTLEGIWIEAREGTVTPLGMEIAFHNATDRDDLVYGEGYWLEECRREEWFVVDVLPGAGFWGDGPSVDYRVPTRAEIEAGSPEDGEKSYDWAWRCGELPEGEYRLVVALISDLDLPITENSPRYYLAAEFSIAG